MDQLYIGTGKVGPRLYLCVLMDIESRMIIGYDFGSTNSDKLKQRLCQSRGIQTIPPKSRYVSSFFSALSAEQMMQYRFHDNDDRTAAEEEYIEVYNEERIHSSLGYKTPREVFTRKHFIVNLSSEHSLSSNLFSIESEKRKIVRYEKIRKARVYWSWFVHFSKSAGL